MSTITVTSYADSGAGSLREAIAEAASGDTIELDASYVQTDSSLIIDKNLTIEREPSLPPFSLSEGLNSGSAVVVEAGVTATFINLNIDNFDSGTDAPDNGADGDDGADGPTGQSGTEGQAGAKGGDGDAGGSATMSNGKAIGPAPALENDGTLTLIRTEIDGGNGNGATGADGHDGGGGGEGGSGAPAAPVTKTSRRAMAGPVASAVTAGPAAMARTAAMRSVASSTRVR